MHRILKSGTFLHVTVNWVKVWGSSSGLNEDKRGRAPEPGESRIRIQDKDPKQALLAAEQARRQWKRAGLSLT